MYLNQNIVLHSAQKFQFSKTFLVSAANFVRWKKEFEIKTRNVMQRDKLKQITIMVELKSILGL